MKRKRQNDGLFVLFVAPPFIRNRQHTTLSLRIIRSSSTISLSTPISISRFLDIQVHSFRSRAKVPCFSIISTHSVANTLIMRPASYSPERLLPRVYCQRRSSRITTATVPQILPSLTRGRQGKGTRKNENVKPNERPTDS